MMLSPFSKLLVHNQWNGRSRCGVQLWILRQPFDRVEDKALFDVLTVQGVPHAYPELEAALYHTLVGLVKGQPFSVKRGVKQGYVLNLLLLCAGLEYAMDKWKLRVQHCGLHCGDDELLRKVHYTGDLVLYARIDVYLASMAESFVEKLADVGLHMYTSKTQILTTNISKMNVPGYWW